MAEALVSLLLEQLRSSLVQEVKLIVGVENEVESLTDTLAMIQAVLKDADEKQLKNVAVKIWLEQLKNVSYDAEDVLDEWITKTLLSKLQKPDENVFSILFSFVSSFKPVVVRHDIGVKIMELNKRLDEIAKKKDMYNLTVNRSETESRLPTSSIVDVSDIYGRNVDKAVIMSKLLGETSHHDSKVPVISIVGTGGFGKTTLAQLILKDEQVIKNFEKQIWVCVSDPFDHEKVAKQIIEQAMGKVIDSVAWETLHMKLSESIRGKRFVLVLDDVWSVNGESWKQLKTSFDGGAIGSRIIITTRDEAIAERMGSTFIHRLGQLSDEDSLKMFKRIAFSQREDDLQSFEDIANDIAKRCGGVPLSIRILASLMRRKKTIQDWRNVQESNMWDVQVQEGEDGFLPSILFSYYALPAELKTCLVYCAILPKDSIIEKKEMIELWMAQGFLGSDGRKDLEIEGGHYFDDLAMCSFFQDFERDSKGNITSCMMHDLVHDFVQFLSKGETLILNKNEELENVNVRHLTIFPSDKPSIYELKKLRTLRSYQNEFKCLGLIHQLTCLRVLDLHYSDVEEFPSEVARLLHLRYLDLSNTELKELPETICNLLNLQTLKLKSCKKLVKLPKGIGKLCSLRHLMIEGTESLKYLPAGLGKLSCLRTLDKFIVGGGDEIEGEGCNIRELRLLNHLGGKLRISNLGEVANANEAKEANLEKKKNLQSLILSFWPEKEYLNIIRCANHGEERILEGLVPHTNLEELKVEFYKGTKLPDWISLLSHLVKLELYYLFSLLQWPALGKLPSLEILELNNLYLVRRIGEEFYGLSGGGGGGRDSVQQIVFPKLKKLKFNWLGSWEEWDLPYQNDNKIVFFPNLVELQISFCDRLQALPSGLGKLKSLKFLKLRHLERLKSFLGPEILGILSINDRKGDNVEKEDNGEFVKPPVVLFPALTSLQLEYMHEWEEETIPDLSSTASITIMPCLSELEIDSCTNLEVIPFYILSPTSIQQLRFGNCEFLDFDFMPDDLKHLTKLQTLSIHNCPILAQRFNQTGEISYKINISPKQQELTEIVESSQSDVHVHIGIRCDNCQMIPIVGKRYKCKDCYNVGAGGFDLCEESYTTPSEHTDLVNQHHTQGHTFELIANRGDYPVQVHPDDPSEDVKGDLVVTKSAEIEEQNKA